MFDKVEKNFYNLLNVNFEINIFEKDKNGVICIKELNQVFKTLNIEENFWKNLIKDIDQNGDGEVFLKKYYFKNYCFK